MALFVHKIGQPLRRVDSFDEECPQGDEKFLCLEEDKEEFKMGINWKEEASNMQKAEELEKLPWADFGVGVHQFKFLEEGNEFSSTLPNGDVIKKVRFVIELNGKRMNWSVNKIDNPTGRSLWGQLVVLGDQNNGLVGQYVSLSVSKDRQGARSYSVQEALKILQSREESSKADEAVQ